MRFILPMAASAVVVICMLFYPITKHYPAIFEMKKKIEEARMLHTEK